MMLIIIQLYRLQFNIVIIIPLYVIIPNVNTKTVVESVIVFDLLQLTSC